MTPDLINGLWEVVGGFFIMTSVWQLYKDKRVRGVHWAHVSFFTLWGWWNMYFYPAEDLWLSFAGGLNVVFWNTIWWAQLIYYSRKERSEGTGSSNPPTSRRAEAAQELRRGAAGGSGGSEGV